MHQLIAWQLGLLQCYLFANLAYSQVTILQSSTNNLDNAELANFFTTLHFCFDLVIGRVISHPKELGNMRNLARVNVHVLCSVSVAFLTPIIYY